MMAIPAEAIVGTTVACSFILLGNAITQSFMGVPALLVDFPPPSSPDHAARARLLGRQWPVFWEVGNVFFRPISTLGIFGYAYTAWRAAGAGELPGSDWRFFALSAACHLATVVHSALNMQPLNGKLDALRQPAGSGKGGAAAKVEVAQAETIARRWIKYNSLRMVMPFIAGSVALWQTLKAL